MTNNTKQSQIKTLQPEMQLEMLNLIHQENLYLLEILSQLLQSLDPSHASTNAKIITTVQTNIKQHYDNILSGLYTDPINATH